ncbi:Dopey, N-terminal-domain-containing protein [Thamnocephalis sphaerospora]|uniref:Dopey, N-terminal-domain-containing protein n=1 Tax=Thamnocephalis sphaerospora TaxID=78915 RepID=A0A4P9XR66_9FUNG|nr:Dopey, N-terminal-domain-containing protein [Thamnocephalis sphaerospora]|eukprot:RKP08001.1 Dopey, N-terminal-domain-containing protein [Thamnocephalis sphaerospora]
MQSALEARIGAEPKYSRYAQLVERNLQSFDTVSEWADVISFLGKLLKAFQLYPQFPVVPHKLVVTKRLAQCLNPALPTGVHQKTLEVYAYILEKIGPDQLACDLSLFAYGLFPFLQHASTSVKPQLLGIFEAHFLPLGTTIVPCLRSFVSALLPGLEEEGSEHFQQVLRLLDSVADRVGTPALYRALWDCLLTSEQWRNAALNYLNRRMPALSTDEEVVSYLGIDMRRVVRAIEATLADTDTLIQRSMLDLLVNRFPLDRKLISEDHLNVLMGSAVHVVLRRDMSLNRRLYTWLLGSSEDRAAQQTYFEKYARQPAADALRHLLFVDTNDALSLQKPFKIIISLLDKWEIGQPVVKDVLLDVMTSLRVHCTQEKQTEGLLKTANMLFDVLEPWQVWLAIAHLVNANTVTSVDHERIRVVEFLLGTLNASEPEIRDVQLPCMVLFVLCKLSVLVDTDGFDLAAAGALSGLAAQLLSRVTSAAFRRKTGSGDWSRLVAQKEAEVAQPVDSPTHRPPSSWHSAKDIFDGLWVYYTADTDPGQVSLPDGISLLRMSLQCMEALLTSLCARRVDGQPEADSNAETALFVGLCQSYEQLVQMRKQLLATRGEAHFERHLGARRQDALFLLLIRFAEKATEFACVDAALSAAITMIKGNYVDALEKQDMTWLGTAIVRLWDFLKPSYIRLHERTVALIWQYTELVGAHAAETVLLQLLRLPAVADRIAALNRLCVFWRISNAEHLPQLFFSRALYITLDALNAPEPALQHTAKAWVQANVEYAHSWLDPLLLILAEADAAWAQMNDCVDLSSSDTLCIDHAQVAFAFRLVCSLLDRPELNMHTMIMRNRLTPQVAQAFGGNSDNATYFDIWFMQYCAGDRARILDQHLEARDIEDHALSVCLHLATSANRLDVSLLQLAMTDVARTLSRRVSMGQVHQQPTLLRLLLRLLRHGTSGSGVAGKDGRVSASERRSSRRTLTSTTEIATILSPAALEAIASHECRSVLRDWIGFIPKFARYLEDADVGVVLPALNRFCQELTRASSQAVSGTGIDSSWDLDALLDGLEEFVVGCLEEEGAVDDRPLDKSNASLHTTGSDLGDGKLRDIVLSQLPVIIQVTIDVWQTIGSEGESAPAADVVSRDSSTVLSPSKHATPWQSHRTQGRIMSFLEHLGVLCRDHTTNALLEVWSKGQNSRVGEDVIHITSQLTSVRPAFVFKKLYKKIKSSGTPRPSHHARISDAGDSFVACFDFLSRYCLIVEPAEWAVLWPRTIEFVRDLVNQGNRSRSFWISCMQYFITAWEKTGSSSGAPERATVLAAEDLCVRLVEVCLLSSRRRQINDDLASSDGEYSVSNELLRPSLEGTVLAERLAYRKRGDGDAKLLHFISSVLVPAMSEMFVDQDRVGTTLALLLHQLILISLRKGNSLHREAALDALSIMCKHPQGIKVLRKDTWDIFLDMSFFPVEQPVAERWKVVIGKIMTSERERLLELLGGISTSNSTLFINRESEALTRARALRRFSFALFCGKHDQYLNQLPSMQEKMVELLKLGGGGVAHVEMFLALRVLFCRIASQHLANFLPVLITEIRRLFLEVYESGEVSIGRVNVVLAACKFIDLLFALNPREFRIHQWLFVAETDEAEMADVSDGQSVALFDLMARRFSSSILSETDSLVTGSGDTSRRRPMIALHHAADLRDLGAFFRQAGYQARRMDLQLAKTDQAAVEASLLNDLVRPVETIKR